MDTIINLLNRLLLVLRLTKSPPLAAPPNQPEPNRIFTLFPLLPPELRLQIWALTLPTRILRTGTLTTAYNNVQLRSHLSQYHHSILTEQILRAFLSNCALRSRRVIESVCPEAREVSVRGRRAVGEVGLGWLVVRGGKGDEWLDPRTDILLIDSDIQRDENREFWKGLWGALGSEAFRGNSFTIGFTFHYMEHFHAPDAEGDNRPFWEVPRTGLVRGYKKSTWPVVMGQMSVLDTREGAMELGVYGLLADAQSVMLDLFEDGWVGKVEEARLVPQAGVFSVERVRELRRKWMEEWETVAMFSLFLGFEGDPVEWKRDGTGPYPVFLLEWNNWI
ncbi:uncharacterized protein C8A04DRAFT_31074 [Dichotomopilus funicola]|uniref:2EXR domain-containing protein n=1 Tax=Dichotomopilus funicola TaxID=1934379 RepID=A0AAN6ZKV7_9PEZI|nr:hypothetical protein C8A04DRAFT_31074 [Dichotomopilus funicola]